MAVLTNPRSDRVKSVRALGRRSVRERTQRFLVEGPQGVREAVRYAADRVVDVYVTPEAAQRYPEIVEAAQAASRYVHEVSDDVLAAMSETDTPQGIIAVVDIAEPTLGEVLARRPKLLVVLTNVRDPGNAGTVIRGADAAGADAVIVSTNSVDVLSPKVVRSTAGSTFHIPVVTGLDIPQIFAELRAAGIRLLAADGSATRTIDEADLTCAHAWVMGNEAWGLEAEVRDACDDVFKVPIHGLAESLNLAMAATICLYTSARVQRQ